MLKKFQATNLKNKEVTVNPKSQTLEKVGFSNKQYPKPSTLNPKPYAYS